MTKRTFITHYTEEVGHGNHAVHEEHKTGIVALPLKARKRLLERIKAERKRGVFISEGLARDLGFKQ